MDDGLSVRPHEKRKLEFSKSMINDRNSEAQFYGKSDKSSSSIDRHSHPHQASTSRLAASFIDRPRTTGSGLSDLLAKEADKRASSSKSGGTSGQQRDDRHRTLSTSMQQRTGTINLKEEREREAARSHRGVKSEKRQPDGPAGSSRLSASLTSRRRQDSHGSHGEGSEDRKPFGKRDAETLTVLEDLETGPIEYGRDPEGMAEWTWVEPNSKINLR